MDVKAGVTDTDSPVAGRAQICNETLAFNTDEEGLERGRKLIGYCWLRGGVGEVEGLPVGSKDTAFASMDLKVTELIRGLPEAEEGIYSGITKRGLHDLLVNGYTESLRKLSDHCASQREWVRKHAALPRLMDQKEWVKKSTACMTTLSAVIQERLDKHIPQVRVYTDDTKTEIQKSLENNRAEIVAKLLMNLTAQLDESKGLAGTLMLAAVKYTVTALIGFGLGLLTAKLKQ